MLPWGRGMGVGVVEGRQPDQECDGVPSWNLMLTPAQDSFFYSSPRMGQNQGQESYWLKNAQEVQQGKSTFWGSGKHGSSFCLLQLPPSFFIHLLWNLPPALLLIQGDKPRFPPVQDRTPSFSSVLLPCSLQGRDLRSCHLKNCSTIHLRRKGKGSS